MIAVVALPGDGGHRVQRLDGTGSPVGPVLSAATAADLAPFTGQDDRWLWDSTAEVYPALLSAGLRVGRCHDVTLTERIVLGREGRFGEPCSAAAVHARATGGTVPAAAPSFWSDQPVLFRPAEVTDHGTDVDPLEVLRAAYVDQRGRAAGNRALGLLLAAESASALAAAEMRRTGLPWRADVHLDLLDGMLGPRPSPGQRPDRLAELADTISAEFGFPVNPDSVQDLRDAFRRAGFDIESTRSWVLKDLDHPAVPAVLRYKELSRMHTANGWGWLDEWVHDGRFRPEYLPGGVVSGRWATRGGGALQIPKPLRRAVIADPGQQLVVADAAQLEPRVLAAVSGDPTLQQLSADTDLYTALASDGFGGSRSKAKVAMLGAMYGATSGEAGRLVGTLHRRYPRAMRFVEEAARRGEGGEVVHSVLGRACPPPSDGWRQVVEIGSQQDATDAERRRADRYARDRGRFTRNFVIQGSAADWASVWLSGLRRDLQAVPGAEVIFFQHDELIVQAPAGSAARVADLTVAAADAARSLVFPGASALMPVRPVVVDCYADAK